ncbi:ATP-binding protein [Streptomyces sp. CA-294286]|uniref:ATP-binding protein n=1 Tax=Streptomyces sp. CA-294286 TaxID=3240070 RepID=UPI003D8A6694
MKQSAAKSIGAAALGAAFVAAAAGSANAVAAPALPDAAGALSTVTAALPVEQVASALPAGGPEALKAGKDALGQSAAAAGESADPVKGLLGGLPTGALPTGGLPGLGG